MNQASQKRQKRGPLPIVPAGLIAIVLVLILALAVRGRGERTLSREGLSMNTVIRISVSGRDEPALAAALDEAFALITRLNDELSIYREGSSLWRVNAQAGGDPVPVPPDVRAVVGDAARFCRLTEGAFNPLVGPITKLWRINQTAGGTYALPAQASLDEALPLTSIDGLELHSGAVRLRRRGAMLDLGGVAKGYASSAVAERLRARGVTSALIDLGGNVQVVGTNRGAPWNIGIRDPSAPRGLPITVLAVSDTAVITSGVYERYRIVDGVRYSHLFDPRTGMPVRNDLLSATVVSPEGALADALATALMVMGSEWAARFLAARPELGVQAVLVREAPSGVEVLATEGLRGAVRNSRVGVRFF